MAKKGPPPKAQRQRTNDRPELLVLAGSGTVAAEAGDWTEPVLEAWRAFWLTPQAQTVTEASLPALVRLFDLRDELVRLQGAIGREGRFTTGSQGQPVVNPAYRIITSLLSEVRQLEDRFALNPEAMVRLGLRIQEGESRADRLNEAAARQAAELEARLGDDDDAAT